MRKVINRPDGSEEIIEGTAEEIAEYERHLREGTKPPVRKSKKPVLHGAELDGKPLTDAEIAMVRLSRIGLLPKEPKPTEQTIWWIPPAYVEPYWLKPQVSNQCSYCGQFNCRQLHIWCSETVTSGKVSLLTPTQTVTLTGLNGLDGASKPH